MPPFNSDGTCIGMIGVAKPAETVMNTIAKTVYPLILVGFLGMLIAGLIGIAVANSWVLILNKIKIFLKEVAVGNLEAQMDLGVLTRKDEIGEMGRFTVTVQKSLQELVEFDNLTGLYNRRFGELKLKQLFEKSQKNGNTFCVAIGDVDFFKKYNETFGHECGDLVLKCVATIIKTHFGKKGFVARWGNEEFLIVTERCDLLTAEEDLQQLLQNIRKAGLLFQGQSLKITMTIGVSQGPGESGFHRFLVDTEDKLYQGQLNGRNRVIK
jgi:diguanylate cyclase (GGDEF)-like protein